MYPLFLKLDNMKCLVIGGGVIAERKVSALIESGAIVTIISPDITEGIMNLVDKNAVKYFKRHFEQNDTKGFFLVIAATNSEKTNSMIYEEVSGSQGLINCVDDPEHCNFYVPARIVRGDLQIAISTAGKLPLIAKKLRVLLEGLLPDSLGNDLSRLHRLRSRIIRGTNGNQKKKKHRIKTELEPEIDTVLKNTGIK